MKTLLLFSCIIGSTVAFSQEYPFLEDFEDSDGGWTVSGENASWEWGMPQASAIDASNDGVNAWVTNLDGNMNTNEVIANVALELHGHELGSYDILNPNDHVNKCQSTNDAYPTGFRVAIYFYTNQLLESLHHLTHQLDQKAATFATVLKMGRTQLQDAVPMSLGDEFAAWSTNLKEEVKNLKRTRDLILELNLGATAIGTGVNAPKGFSELAIGYLQKFTKASFV